MRRHIIRTYLEAFGLASRYSLSTAAADRGCYYDDAAPPRFRVYKQAYTTTTRNTDTNANTTTTGMSMIKGECGITAVLPSEAALVAVVGGMMLSFGNNLVTGGGGGGGEGDEDEEKVRMRGLVVRWWNGEWAGENPDLAIDGEDLGMGMALDVDGVVPVEERGVGEEEYYE
ncbi:hypothetical protein SLS55_000929 [Diplodia seriata]|uniref:Uncharacterized protein n=1 Tax=Diplodia seriata TaxID=420778 RepID=A0ABR3CYP6_9PEZI